jgi:mannose-6-phosphate isomerase-like protein (cupin superfamily)
MMKNIILDVQQFKKFNDKKANKETLWTGNTSRINIINLRPGQEIKPHIHDGDHIWIILEGSGEFLSFNEESSIIDVGKIVIAPAGEGHGIRNNTKGDLVFVSITV